MDHALTRVSLERTHDGRGARVFLNRPEVRNAFDDALVNELRAVFAGLASNPFLRVVVLGGKGPVFCAGADLNWMGRMISYSFAENHRDAAALAALLRLMDEFPKPLVGRIQGAALGGGTGLAALCDVVVAAEGCLFGTTEVRLGIVPAVISPYVVRKIGESHARAWFLTGRRVGADEALRAGLVHRLVPEPQLDEAVEEVVSDLLLGGPEALAVAKKLARSVGRIPLPEAIPLTVDAISERRVSAEGQEGMEAFLGKRAPRWTEPGT